MAWLCKDLDGTEWISNVELIRDEKQPVWMCLGEPKSGYREWDSYE